MTHATEIRVGVTTFEGHVKTKLWKQDNNKIFFLSLTVEGLGADLAVRSGHSTAMTRRGDGVTLHALHGLPCTSGCQSHKPSETPTLSLRMNASPQNRSDIRRADWPALDEISLRFWTYGPSREREGEWKRERGGKGERRCGAWREARGRSPCKANNSQQSCSVPEVLDPHHLLHTGLVILSRLCDSNFA